MKRSSPLKRRTALKPMSKSKELWVRRYRDLKKATISDSMQCAICKRRFGPEMMEPHHPAGRVGSRILVFRWLCKRDHQWTHDHGKEARELGIILPQFDGRKPTPETQNYFNISNIMDL